MAKSDKTSPPKTAQKIISIFSGYEENFSIDGDLEEIYRFKREKNGKTRAGFWYWKQTFKLFTPYLSYSIRCNLAMFRNYSITALRRLRREKLLSFINITGLAVSFAACCLIFLYITDEFSFDRFHKKGDRTYSVVTDDHYYENSYRNTMFPLASILAERFPEIENFVRTRLEWGVVVKHEENIFEEDVLIVDPQFFEVFTFPLKTGSKKDVLSSENSIVLTRSSALKYFGEENPLGKTLLLTFGEKSKSFTVSGIAENVPPNSTIDFDFLINTKNLGFIYEPEYAQNWIFSRVQAFLLLKENNTHKNIEENLLAALKPFLVPFYNSRERYNRLVKDGETVTYRLQNLKDIHLYSSEIRGTLTSSINRSYILAGIALIILFVAAVNFVNLSIAGAARRSIEIGIRKVLGSNRNLFIRQFWSESVAIVLFSMILGLMLAVFLLPAFNNISDKNLTPVTFFKISNLFVFLIFVVFAGILSGSFPALVMSRLKPAEILKERVKGRSGNFFRTSLVVIQFSFAVFLIIVTLVLSKQIKYMKSFNPGYEKDGLLVISLYERDSSKCKELLNLYKDRISGYHSVIDVSGCVSSPNKTLIMSSINLEGKRVGVYFNSVYYNYINTMKMKLVEGRDFSEKFTSDTSAIIVNKKFVEDLDLKSPLGKTVRLGMNQPLRIIGVVENYNYMSLEEEIGPAALNMIPRWRLIYALVRVSATGIPETLKFLEQKWEEITPDKPFQFSFLDDDLECFYVNENRWNKIVRYSSVLTIIITCMGLFGLTLIRINQRVKEIGIRKVFGASIYNVINIVIKDIVLFVFIACLISWPVSYFTMNKWLNGYAYRTALNAGPFLFAGLLALVIAVFTVSYIAFKAAGANPVDSIRYE